MAAIFIKPKYQGKGIGSKLMDKAKLLRKEIKLAVYAENLNSIFFYKKHGFRKVKEQNDIHTGYKFQCVVTAI